MLIISTFYWGHFQQKAIIINILPRLRISTYAYAYALVKTSIHELMKKKCQHFDPLKGRKPKTKALTMNSYKKRKLSNELISTRSKHTLMFAALTKRRKN